LSNSFPTDLYGKLCHAVLVIFYTHKNKDIVNNNPWSIHANMTILIKSVNLSMFVLLSAKSLVNVEFQVGTQTWA